MSKNFQEFISFIHENREKSFIDAASNDLLRMIEIFRRAVEPNPLDIRLLIIMKAVVLFQKEVFGKSELAKCNEAVETDRLFEVEHLKVMSIFFDTVLNKAMEYLDQQHFEPARTLASEADETYKYLFKPDVQPIKMQTLLGILSSRQLHEEYFRCKIAKHMFLAHENFSGFGFLGQYVVPAIKFLLLDLLLPGDVPVDDKVGTLFQLSAPFLVLIVLKRVKQVDHLLAVVMCVLAKIRPLIPERSRWTLKIPQGALMVLYVDAALLILTISLNKLNGKAGEELDNGAYEEIYDGTDDMEYELHINQLPLQPLTTKHEMQLLLEKARHWMETVREYTVQNCTFISGMMKRLSECEAYINMYCN